MMAAIAPAEMATLDIARYLFGSGVLLARPGTGRPLVG